MSKVYCRIYQLVFKIAAYFLPWSQPELLEGEGSLKELPDFMKARGMDNVLVVTDEGLLSLGLMDGMLNGFDEAGIRYTVYSKTVANPTIDNIEEALEMYKSCRCTAIVAFGGGSPMDCAKGVAARLARPQKTIPQLKGQLKILKKTPPLVAVPTTAGTGSETTLAAVITNSRTREKYAINDTVLIPRYAVLDPLLTAGLPPRITSTTGVDALTHAVEAYIGRSNTKKTREDSRAAIKLIFANLLTAYRDGANMEARANMQKAAFLAGAAFTRAYVGYVHAIAHTLGGFYSVPHGLANAVILPYVLEAFGPAAHKKLAELADLVNLTQPEDTVTQKARRFIDAVKELNQKLEIPDKIKGIQDEDIPLMVERALSEAHPLYPVPRIMSREEITSIYNQVKE